ncbi:MAG: ribonuclease P protein component, partial [Gemmatimonadales bacterium]
MPRFVGRGPGPDRDCSGLGPGSGGGRSNGLGRSRRITRHVEFVYAQRSGRRVTTAHFLLLVAARPAPKAADASSPTPARLGIVTSRKVGGAVQRNRVRRLCRECFRGWPELLPAGVDLVVIARPGASTLGLATV